ncbi:MAG: hypothetical protein LBM93_15450 [Oscillospiraceae bacterium]|jgi:hypothetical protein|nr:hypothetical protein [Oscillospiraceae bacterium]
MAPQRQPLNRQQRRAEAKKNEIRLKQEEKQKLEAFAKKADKDPKKAEKIEKKYKEYDTKRVLWSFVAIMIAFFVLLGFIIVPAVM